MHGLRRGLLGFSRLSNMSYRVRVVHFWRGDQFRNLPLAFYYHMYNGSQEIRYCTGLLAQAAKFEMLSDLSGCVCVCVCVCGTKRASRRRGIKKKFPKAEVARF